ncbi:MAG TPA: hypothetical protein VGJ91_00740, partial [Polyangiaceae bacterium]
MARSSLHTSLALLVALVSGCGTAGPSTSDAGQPGVADPTAATQPSADSDGDRLPADQDQCPNTPAGVAVDGNGCSIAQRKAQTSSAMPAGSDVPGSEGNGANAGGANAAAQGRQASNADGTVGANGFAVFVLDPEGALPVTLRTLASNVSALENGFALAGTVTVDVPGNAHVTLAEAKVSLGYDASKGSGLQRFEGSVRLPFPNLGFMQGVSVSDPVYAAVGYDFGQRLTNVDAPLEAERKYLYFTFSTGFQAKLGDMTVSAGNGQSVTM